MKKLFKSTFAVVLSLLISTSAFAHSGRTDSSGGHKDNKNVSGLGSYHYHHGYSAHLHTNGVCPYATTSTSSSSSSSTSVSSKPVTTSKNYTKTTDIKAYINDSLISSVNYNDATYIIAEDLQSYGFSVSWNGTDRTLKIKDNGAFTKTNNVENNSSTVYEILDTDIKTYIYNSTTNQYDLITSYNIGGNTIIKFSDVGNSSWNQNERTASITK